MAMFDRLAERVESRARTMVDHAVSAFEVAVAEFPDIKVRRDGDSLAITGRGLLRRWMSDVRVRFLPWGKR